jgi:hypothetical protein
MGQADNPLPPIGSLKARWASEEGLSLDGLRKQSPAS